MDVFLWCDYDAQIPTTTIVDNVLTAFYGHKIAMSYTQCGAPVIDDNRYMSVSHSHNVLAVSVSDCPVGCDVERILPRKYERIVQYLHLPDCSDLREFYYQWTAYEARYKVGNADAMVKHFPLGGLSGVTTIRHFPLNEEYLLAIATDNDNINFYNIQDTSLMEDLWFLKR